MANDVQVYIVQGDIFKQDTDAIVNPANEYLTNSGGLADAISKKAGPAFDAECKSFIQKYVSLRKNENIHTTAGNIPPPIKYVVHAVGPRYDSQNPNRNYLGDLADCYFHCFCYINYDMANSQLQVHSVAVPAISTGIFSMPMGIAAKAARLGFDRFRDFVMKISGGVFNLTKIVFVISTTNINLKKEFDKAFADVASTSPPQQLAPQAALQTPLFDQSLQPPLAPLSSSQSAPLVQLPSTSTSSSTPASLLQQQLDSQAALQMSLFDQSLPLRSSPPPASLPSISTTSTQSLPAQPALASSLQPAPPVQLPSTSTSTPALLQQLDSQAALQMALFDQSLPLRSSPPPASLPSTSTTSTQPLPQQPASQVALQSQMPPFDLNLQLYPLHALASSSPPAQLVPLSSKVVPAQQSAPLLSMPAPPPAFAFGSPPAQLVPLSSKLVPAQQPAPLLSIPAPPSAFAFGSPPAQLVPLSSGKLVVPAQQPAPLSSMHMPAPPSYSQIQASSSSSQTSAPQSAPSTASSSQTAINPQSSTSSQISARLRKTQTERLRFPKFDEQLTSSVGIGVPNVTPLTQAQAVASTQVQAAASSQVQAAASSQAQAATSTQVQATTSTQTSIQPRKTQTERLRFPRFDDQLTSSVGIGVPNVTPPTQALTAASTQALTTAASTQALTAASTQALTAASTQALTAASTQALTAASTQAQAAQHLATTANPTTAASLSLGAFMMTASSPLSGSLVQAAAPSASVPPPQQSKINKPPVPPKPKPSPLVNAQKPVAAQNYLDSIKSGVPSMLKIINSVANTYNTDPDSYVKQKTKQYKHIMEDSLTRAMIRMRKRIAPDDDDDANADADWVNS